ncbi:MAG: glycosyltransferase family 4 protein [Acidobacteria bacterium]|nr:glycosyltransferase family 4 protein [Acidobacteriota bacterium]
MINSDQALSYRIIESVRNTKRAALSQISIFTPFIHAFGGAERLILALSQHLHEQNLPHGIVCFRQTINLKSYADWPFEVHQLSPPRHPLAEGRALRWYVRQSHQAGSPPLLIFDLKGAFYAGLASISDYYLHLTDPPSLLPLDISKKGFSVRRLYSQNHSMDLFGATRGEIVHRINRRGVRKAKSVIVMTDRISKELQALYSVKPQIIHPGGRIRQTRNLKCNLDTDRIHILSVCRLELSKRVDWILYALAKLESSDPPLSQRANWVLDIVGEGTQSESLKRLASQLGISSRTVFHNYMPDNDLEQIYSAAHLFVMPAVQGYGLPALEALGRHLPVVMSKESGVVEVLSGTKWVDFIDDNVESLAVSIDRMLDRLSDDGLQLSKLPTFPTEPEWAQRICRFCGWL